jgi:hypothetical protein
VTHLIEVAGLFLQVPFIRLLIGMTVVTLLWDAYLERKSS